MDIINWKGSSVKELHSTDEAEDQMKSKELCMVIIYAAWCGHCKRAAPIIKKLSDKVKGKATIYVIESEKYSGDKAKGYPTILIVKDGKLSKYEGDREVDAMKHALLKGDLSGGKRSRRRGTRRLRKRARKTHRALR